jgi:hypothetical protein
LNLLGVNLVEQFENIIIVLNNISNNYRQTSTINTFNQEMVLNSKPKGISVFINESLYGKLQLLQS